MRQSPTQHFEQELKRQRYSPNTIKIYCTHFFRFAKSFDKELRRVTKNEIKQYLNAKQLSYTAQNQAINAIKFYYEKCLGQKKKLYNLRRPRKNNPLPRIIDHQLIIDRLNKIPDLKAKTMLSLCYSTGVRVSELVRIKVDDIDTESDPMLICIYNGKGRKTRYVKLSDGMLTLLRKYYVRFKPSKYLFEGKNGGYVSPSTASKYYKKYIDPDTGIHTLRHSAFTKMIENGTDISIVQKTAGHKSIETTRKYIHLSKKSLRLADNPI